MAILYGLFTVILFVDCILLIGFVLVQLPKKEAGAGMAFGGAATDALFGAGSGSAVTVITKYLAGIFFGLSLIMAIMTSPHGQGGASSAFEKALSQGGAGPASKPITDIPDNNTPATTGSSNSLKIIPSTTPAASNNATPATAPSSGNLSPLQLTPPAGTNK